MAMTKEQIEHLRKVTRKACNFLRKHKEEIIQAMDQRNKVIIDEDNPEFYDGENLLLYFDDRWMEGKNNG